MCSGAFLATGTQGFKFSDRDKNAEYCLVKCDKGWCV